MSNEKEKCEQAGITKETYESLKQKLDTIYQKIQSGEHATGSDSFLWALENFTEQEKNYVMFSAIVKEVSVRMYKETVGYIRKIQQAQQTQTPILPQNEEKIPAGKDDKDGIEVA